MINAVNLGFTLSIIVLLVIFEEFNFITMEIIKFSILGAISVALGIYLGGKLHHQRYLKKDSD